MKLLSPFPSGLDAGQPVEWDHPLNEGRLLWLLAAAGGHPSYSGGPQWLNLCRKNSGTLTNGPTWQGPSGRPGGQGSVSFDGVDDYVPLPDLSAAFPSNEATFAVWVKRLVDTPANDAQSGLAALHASGTTETHYPFSNGLVYVSLFDTARNVNALSTPDRSVWRRLVVTTAAGAGNYQVYMDRQLLTAVTRSGFYAPPSPTFGRSANAAYYYEGWADDLGIWSRALSAAEVAQDYDLSRRGYPGVLRRQSSITYFLTSGGGPVSYTRSCSEAPTTAEGVLRALIAGRTVIEAPTTTESVTSPANHPRSASEAPTTLDSITRAGTFSRTATAGPTTIDSPVRTLDAHRSTGDNPTTVDAATRIGIFSRTTANAPLTIDSADVTKDKLASATDAPHTAESPTRTFVGSRTTTDSPTTLDAVTRTEGTVRTTTEAPTTIEQAIRAWVTSRTTVDTPTTTDSIVSVVAKLRTTTETPRTSELVTRLFVGFRTTAESPRTVESIVAIVHGAAVGPFFVEAGAVYVPGAEAGSVYVPGSEAGEGEL